MTVPSEICQITSLLSVAGIEVWTVDAGAAHEIISALQMDAETVRDHLRRTPETFDDHHLWRSRLAVAQRAGCGTFAVQEYHGPDRCRCETCCRHNRACGQHGFTAPAGARPDGAG